MCTVIKGRWGPPKSTIEKDLWRISCHSAWGFMKNYFPQCMKNFLDKTMYRKFWKKLQNTINPQSKKIYNEFLATVHKYLWRITFHSAWRTFLTKFLEFLVCIASEILKRQSVFLYNLSRLNDFICQKCLKLKLRLAFVTT